MKIQIPHLPYLTSVALIATTLCAATAMTILWPLSIHGAAAQIVVPMTASLAIMLLVCSAALCALEYRRRAVAIVLASVIALSITATIASWVLNVAPPFQVFLFGIPNIEPTFFPSVAARDAAMPVALASLAIALLASNAAPNAVRPLGWASGLMLVLAPVLRYLASQFAPLPPQPDLQEMTPAAATVLTSLAVTLLGVALMGSRNTSSLADGTRTTIDWGARVRATIIVVVLSVTLNLWYAVRAGEIRQLQSELTTATDTVVTDWRRALGERIRAINRLNVHWAHLNWNVPDAIFLADSEAFMHDYAQIHAIAITNTQGRIVKIARRMITLGAPPSSDDLAVLADVSAPGFELPLDDNGLSVARRAITRRATVRNDPSSTENGVNLLQLAAPAFDANQQLLGTLVLFYRRDLNDAALLEGSPPDFHLRVFTNGDLTYSRPARDDNAGSWPRPHAVTKEVQINSNTFLFEVAPSTRIINRNLTWTPALILLFAWATLILLTFALYNERRAYALARDRERILNESLDLICTLDAQGRCVTVNETSQQVLGFSAAEIIGRDFADLVHPGDQAMLAQQWQDAQAGNQPAAMPLRFVHKNGGIVYLQGNAHWSPHEQRFFCDMRDVSEQHALELAREHAASTLKTGVEQAGCVVYEYRYDTQQITWVGAIYALTGYVPEELASLSFAGWMEAIHPDDRTHVSNTLQRCLESRQPHIIDYRLRRKDGNYVPVLDRGRHVDDAQRTQPRMIGALIDLSAIRQQENALRRSEERYRIIATQVGAVIFERDIIANEVRIFGPVEQIYGYTKEQIESRPYGAEDTMIHPDDRARVNATIAAATQNLSSYDLEYRRRHRGGHYVHIAARGVVLPGADGLAERSVIAITDITERKQAEARLQESEERFRFAAEQARQIIYEYIVGEQLEILALRFAGATEAVLGYTAADLSAIQAAGEFALVHPEDIPAARVALDEAIATGQPYNIEQRLRHKDGHYIHIENRSAIHRDADGHITGAVGMLFDISARKAADAERQAYVLQLSKLADIARKVSTLLSQHQLFDYLARSMRELMIANAAAIVMRDSTLADVRTTTVSYVQQPALQRAEAVPLGSQELHDLLNSGDKPVRLTVAQTSADPRWANRAQNDNQQPPLHGWLGAPLITRDGVAFGLLEVTGKLTGDFTESDAQALSQLAGLASVAVENIRLYATLEERVAARTRELQVSNRELEAFSYSVSHDLRAPLRAIAGFSSILEQEYAPKLDAAARRYIMRIGSGVERMANLIDDLLSLARVSRLDIKRESIDLSGMCRSIVKRQLERWPEHKLQIKIDPRMRIDADPRLVEVALENLVENAIKFTSTRAQGQIHIGKRAANGKPAFFVQDNGVGFDPQYATNLFGVFQRLHSASEFPGTGVGLATVQRIMQRHHGSVWAESQIDAGATFYFTFDSEA